MANEKARVLSRQELCALSINDRQNLMYDISRMQKNQLDPILNAVKKYGTKHLHNLTFTLDLYYEYFKSEFPQMKDRSSRIQQTSIKVEPFTLENSAYRKKPHAITSLIYTLSAILPKSSSLRILCMKSMLLNGVHIQKLCDSVSLCTSLHVLTFNNVTLFDEGFTILCHALQNSSVTSLTCQSCGLTDASIGPLRDLLSYKATAQRKSGKLVDRSTELSAINLKDNSFSTRILLDIGTYLTDLPITLFDVSDNHTIDVQVASNLRRSAPHVELVINSQKSKASSRKGKKKKAKQIKSPEVVLGPNLKIKGEKSIEFFKYIKDICNLAEQLDDDQVILVPNSND